MVNQRRVVNVAHRHAVVADDDDALALFVDLLAFQQALLVGIHHDQQCAGRDNIQRLVRRDEVVSLACIDESLQQRACQGASLLTAMTAGTPQILQMRSTPMAEPMASSRSCGGP